MVIKQYHLINHITLFFQGCVIPQRYILGVMGLMGVCNAYTMRVCLNFAITQMVNKTKIEGGHVIDPNACPDDAPIGNQTTQYKPVSTAKSLESLLL